MKLNFLILTVFFVSIAGLSAQNELPLVLQEQINVFDTISDLSGSMRFEQVFGKVQQKARVLHITKSQDSLVLFPMYKAKKIDNLMILTTKGKLYILNKESVITKEIVRKTPLRKYFTRFYRLLDIDYTEHSELGHWFLKKRFFGVSLKWKSSNSKNYFGWDGHIDAPKTQKNISSADLLDWGQDNTGDWDNIMANHILAFVQSKSGKGTTVERISSENTDTIPTFTSFQSLGKHLDSTKIEIDTSITTVKGSYVVELPQELYQRIIEVCHFKNSHNETIDDYFKKNNKFLKIDFEKHLNNRFLSDKVFTRNLDGFFMEVRNEIKENNYSTLGVLMDMKHYYPACSAALPYLK